MTQRIIYPNDNGGVSILIPAPEARQQVLVSEAVTEIVTHDAVLDEDGVEVTPAYDETVTVTPAVYRDQTDDEFMEWIANKDVPEGKPYKIVDVSDIPEDRTFRDAWEYAE
jgi:hypothetical protein